MRETQAFGPPSCLRQHLLRDIDAGDPRIPTEMGERQTGADANLQNPLARPIVGDAHRLLASGVKNRAEYNIVGAGKQPIGTDGIVQIHRIALCHF